MAPSAAVCCVRSSHGDKRTCLGNFRGVGAMPHWLVALGSIVGLITGIYTLFEKVLKQRPLIWVTRSEARRDNMLVRVRNTADQDIAIIGDSVRPPIYMLAYSEHLDAIFNAQTNQSPYRMIRPER